MAADSVEPGTAVDPPSLMSVEVHPFDMEARLFLATASEDRFQVV